jgi:predicted component of type VI protein secretion system
MGLKLIVLAGAKLGTEIPLSKDEFVIGRSKECALRAGSEAISRRHCLIARQGDHWSVRDLGSRNGTYVNDKPAEGSVPLSAGDELRVGPLKFRVDAVPAAAVERKSADIPRGKQPPVKDVSDVAERTASKSDGSATEDDISRWLLGVADPKADESLKETRTIRMEETTTISRPKLPADQTAENGPADTSEAADGAPEEEGPADGKSGGWSWLKLNKGAAPAKKKPGKLPARPVEQSSKDSGEAAADILREMTRRR